MTDVPVVGERVDDDAAPGPGRRWIVWGASLVGLVVLLVLASGALRQIGWLPLRWAAAVAIGAALLRLSWAVAGPGHLPVAWPISIGSALLLASAGVITVILKQTQSGRWDLILVPAVAVALLAYGIVVEGLRNRESGKVGWRVAATAVSAFAALAAVLVSPSGTILGADPGVVVGIAVGVAVVSGHVATELWSGWLFARWDDRPADARDDARGVGAVEVWDRGRVQRLFGPVAAVLIAGSLVAIGLGTHTALGTAIFVGILAVAAFVGVAASEHPLTIVVIAIAVFLITFVAPGDDPPDFLEVTDGEDYFLVLGDSYTSGEGDRRFLTGTNDAYATDDGRPDDRTGECRRSVRAWPVRLAALAADPPDGEPVLLDGVPVPPNVRFVACSGSVTENIRATEYRKNGSKDPSGPAQLAGLEGLPPPKFIILGVGGNDASFSKIAGTCLAPGNCDELADHYLHAPGKTGASEEHYESLDAIDDDLVEAYTNVVDQYPETTVFVTAYPDAVRADGPCLFFSEEERRFVVSYIHQLNDKIEAKVDELDDQPRYRNLTFLEGIEGSLRGGHQLCDDPGLGDSGINPVTLNPVGGRIRDALHPGKLAHNSVHPTACGHRMMLASVVEVELEPEAGCSDGTPGRGDEEDDLVEVPCSGLTCDAKAWPVAQVQDALVPALPTAALALLGWSALWALIASTETPVGRWIRGRPRAAPDPT